MNSSTKAWVRALELTAPIKDRPNRTLPSLIDEWADRFGAAPALIAPDATLTYASLAQWTNRYSRWALNEGLGPADVVCLLMTNQCHYMAIWLGLTRIGVTVALLNTHLRGEPLANAVSAAAPRALIVGESLLAAAKALRSHVRDGVQYWSHGVAGSPWPSLSEAAAALPGHALAPSEFSAPSLGNRALYVYTSGTTGLPKAAIVSHFRIMQWSHWFAGLMGMQASDRMYNCLPMYHSIGGVVATAAPLVAGGAVVVRERFSAREFWRDIAEERCTVFQYIGELCRYLLAAPPSPEEAGHSLRLCCGNGLRRDVWIEFQHRFQIPQILEYYASTEGSFSLYNCDGRPGAIGRIPPFLRHRTSVALVSYDPASELPARDAGGRCIRCQPGETGEAIGEITGSNGEAVGRFEGYTDRSASQKKVLRGVFSRDDAWYRTGDLMRQDAEGYFYFVDRVGDTYRWKGENVSTAEVSEAIAACAGVKLAAVYGVAIDGTEGRAGMAALVVNDKFSLQKFREELAERLPDYARPLFLRIAPTLEITGTFRFRKQELARDGFDPKNVSDALYFDDRDAGAYVALVDAMYQRIVSGRVRV